MMLEGTSRPRCYSSDLFDDVSNETQVSYNLPRQEEVTSILEEISHLDEVINRLKEKQATLRTRLNDIRAPIGTLPDEVLSHIFELVSPGAISLHYEHESHEYSNDPCYPIILSSISGHWRKVAKSTPRLWNRLTLGLGPSTVHRQTSLMRLCFKNAGHIPVQLELFVPPWGEPDVTFKPIADLMFFNSRKIQSLCIHDIPATWISSFSTHLPILVCLELFQRRTSDRAESLCLLDAPSLRRVKLSNLNLITVQLPWDQITELRLVNIPSNIPSELLIKCPNLLHYGHISELYVLSWEAPLLPDDIITLSNMKSFTWSCDCSERESPSVAILPYIRLPNLHELELIAKSESLPRALHVFLSNLPSTVTHLTLRQVADDLSVSAMRDLFLYLPQVVHLSAVGHRTGISMLQALTPELSAGSKPSSLLLPHLRLLDCGPITLTQGYSVDNAKNAVDKLITMLERRHRAGWSESFRLNTNKSVAWTYREKEKLAKLVSDGIPLSITEDSQEVD